MAQEVAFSTDRPSVDVPTLAHLAGKFMTFKLADEIYGLEILKVREIIRLLEITRVPRSEGFMRGVVNLRGKVIPVVDLRLRFGMSLAEGTNQTVIIVVQCLVRAQLLTVGLLVDQVLEVLSVNARDIDATPSLGDSSIDISFIQGVGKTGDRVVFLLDIDRVLVADASSSPIG